MCGLRIVHRTHYRYYRPVRFGEHRLVIRPREGHDLRVERLSLSTRPQGVVEWSRDVFGNSIARVNFDEPSDELLIESNVTIWRSPDAHPPASAPAAEEWPVVYDPLEAGIAEAYRKLVYPFDGDAVRDWLGGIDWPGQRTAENMLVCLNGAIHRSFTYRRRNEAGVLTPAQVIDAGSGSCRDLATLMLEAARRLGFAARFASGYLDNAASASGHGVTHAWAEAYLPRRGWRGFDPTLGEHTSLQHVVTGVSNHPRGVMPVSGRYDGQRGDFRGMDVSVRIERVRASHGAGNEEIAAPHARMTTGLVEAG